MVSGLARPILSAERTALNLLGRLCGIATATRGLVQAVEGCKARITCTRKTTPGLRALEKEAVRLGGGSNHRFGLDDAVLIKDNHLIAGGGIQAAVARARAGLGHMVKIEVEVDTLAQLEELIPLGVDAVLLDNMPPETLARAVRMVDGRMLTEASGNINAQHRPRRGGNRRRYDLRRLADAQRHQLRRRPGLRLIQPNTKTKGRPSPESETPAFCRADIRLLLLLRGLRPREGFRQSAAQGGTGRHHRRFTRSPLFPTVLPVAAIRTLAAAGIAAGRTRSRRTPVALRLAASIGPIHRRRCARPAARAASAAEAAPRRAAPVRPGGPPARPAAWSARSASA